MYSRFVLFWFLECRVIGLAGIFLGFRGGSGRGGVVRWVRIFLRS